MTISWFLNRGLIRPLFATLGVSKFRYMYLLFEKILPFFEGEWLI